MLYGMICTEEESIRATVVDPKLDLELIISNDKIWKAVVSKVDVSIPMLIGKWNDGVIIGAGECLTPRDGLAL